MTLVSMNTRYNEKLKSFEQYHALKQTEKLIQKAYTDHLLNELAKATQSQPDNKDEVLQSLNELKEMVKPSHKFFMKIDKPVPVKAKEVADSKNDAISIQRAKMRAKAIENYEKKQKG